MERAILPRTNNTDIRSPRKEESRVAARSVKGPEGGREEERVYWEGRRP